MKTLSHTTSKGRKLYDISDELCEQLLDEGEKALEQCYPKSGEGYAVSVLTSKGKIFTGASYKSETYTLTMHSEAVALAHATQHGEREVVAITGPNCHICKQLIWESSLNSGIEIVIVIKEDGIIKKVPISEMMSYPWPDEQGNK